MRSRAAPRLSRWPFFMADGMLLGLAWLIYWQSKAPMTVWDTFFCAGSVAFGAGLCVTPFLLEYRAAMKLTEADRLADAVLQIENLEILGRQITQATAGWQTAHEHATNTVDAAREIAQSLTTEARAFGEFLKKANDSEKNHLRLEVEKLRRVENEWLQILVRILDHIFALYQAARHSGQANLIEQIGQFQNACRDIARRVGLVPFVVIPGEPYDPKVHQLADASLAPAADARVAETIATGYSYQGQLVRPVLVALQGVESQATTEHSGLSTGPFHHEPAEADPLPEMAPSDAAIHSLPSEPRSENSGESARSRA